MSVQENKTEYTVKEIQAEMLVLLKIFHKFCVDHSIHYSVHAGTMIGTVRDHGFIEWDDDADVSFTRAEYNKFRDAWQKEDHAAEFYFSEYDNAFPQLWMKREGKPAVWTDMFIYDHITESRIGQKIKIMRIAVLLGLLKNKETIYLTKKRGLYKGLKYAVIYCGYLLGKTMSKDRKIRFAEKTRQSMPGNKTLIHRSNDRYIGIGFVYPNEVMSEYINLPFEDTEIMITKRYDDILIPSYGDYMTPVKTEDGEAEIHTYARDVLPGAKINV